MYATEGALYRFDGEWRRKSRTGLKELQIIPLSVILAIINSARAVSAHVKYSLHWV